MKTIMKHRYAIYILLLFTKLNDVIQMEMKNTAYC